MSAAIIACLLSVQAAAAGGRPFHEIERQIGDALSREARAESFAERSQAVCDLAALFDEVRRDPRRETSDTLAALQTRIRTRLLKVQKDLLRRQAREKKAPAAAASDAGLLENARAIEISQAETSQAESSTAVSSALAMQLDWFGATQGGAARLISDGARSQGSSAASAGGRGGGVVPDNGPALVDLIERTISPDHWDVNGGPGAIVYYQPLHVLVIRASGEVHGRVGGLLGGLRAAGP